MFANSRLEHACRDKVCTVSEHEWRDKVCTVSEHEWRDKVCVSNRSMRAVQECTYLVPLLQQE
ncbi:hypothetical protein DFP94_112121 [Fontibacillus phaseoli]|uniref:Uncharacterized protein n=1 Tax=Fontibacillus phaseoli TaxID=1416533 RepID=A0A369B4Z6_9BACL|nr:hypothetical protein DFP94_112121 [Fontibacillus phaseoli]